MSVGESRPDTVTRSTAGLLVGLGLVLVVLTLLAATELRGLEAPNSAVIIFALALAVGSFLGAAALSGQTATRLRLSLLAGPPGIRPTLGGGASCWADSRAGSRRVAHYLSASGSSGSDRNWGSNGKPIGLRQPTQAALIASPALMSAVAGRACG